MKKHLIILILLFTSVTMYGQIWAVKRNANFGRMKVAGDTIWMSAEVAGNKRIIVRSNNGGVKWDTLNPKNGTNDLNPVALHILGPQKILAADGFGNIFLTVNDGTTWAQTLSGGISSSEAIHNFYFLNASTGFAARTNSGEIYKTTNGGSSWAKVGTCSIQVFNIFFPSATIGYATGVGKIAKTTDGGATWTVIYNTTFQYVSLFACYFFDDQKGFATGELGILLKTVNGGQKWDTIKVAKQTITSITFRDANNGWFLQNNGDIYKTSDGGTTWVSEYVEKAYNGGGISGAIVDLGFNKSGTGWAITEGTMTLTKYFPNSPILALTTTGTGVTVNATFSLGNVYAGDSIVKQFEIKNQGNLANPFAVGDFKLTGETGSYRLTSVPGSLGIGIKDTFTVVFKPNKIGVLTASVSIKNSTTGNVIKFNFTGTVYEKKNQLFHYPLYSDFKDTSGLNNDAIPNNNSRLALDGICIGTVDTFALNTKTSISFPQTDFTFATNVRFNTAGNDFHTIASEYKRMFFIGYKESTKRVIVSFLKGVWDTNSMQYVISRDTISIATPQLADGSWHSLVLAVYTNNLYLYVDNVAIKPVSKTLQASAHTDVLIGQVLKSNVAAIATDSSLNGCIKNIRWFNKGMNTSEIQKLLQISVITSIENPYMATGTPVIYPTITQNELNFNNNQTAYIYLNNVSGIVTTVAVNNGYCKFSDMPNGIYSVRGYTKDGELLFTEKIYIIK